MKNFGKKYWLHKLFLQTIRENGLEQGCCQTELLEKFDNGPALTYLE